MYTFMEFAKILAIDEQTVEKTISLRQIKKITLGDAIIAATALVHDLTLITHNISDFKNIDGLKVIDPYMINNSAISGQLPDNP